MNRVCEGCGRQRAPKALTRKCPICGGRFVPAERAKDPPASRAGTSARAADKARAFTGRMKRRVLEAIVKRGERGGTDEEVMEELGTSANGVRPRRVELESMGLVRDSGARRKTRARLDAIVWTATGAGERALRETEPGVAVCLKNVTAALEQATKALELARSALRKTPCRCEPCTAEALDMFANVPSVRAT